MKTFQNWLSLRENVDPRRLKKAAQQLQFMAKNRPDVIGILHKIGPDMLQGNLSDQLAQAVLAAGEDNDLDALVQAYQSSRNPAAAAGGSRPQGGADPRKLKQAFQDLSFMAKNRVDVMTILNKIQPYVLDGKLKGPMAQALLNAAETNDLDALVQAYQASRKLA
jgi:hypothetical protein